MDSSPLIEIGLPLVLAVIMVGIGLTLTTEDFARERRAPRAAVVGTLLQLVGMPAAAFAVAAVLDLAPAVAVGLVVAAACPGGATSNLVAFLARANVALSIVLTVVASAAVLATLPFWTGLALDAYPLDDEVGEVAVPLGPTVGLLLGVVLVPVAVGMLVRRRAPALAARLERVVGVVGVVVLAALVVGITLSVSDQVGELLRTSGPASLLLSVLGVVAGLVAGTLVRVPLADRVTLALELGVKNTTLGLLITLSVIGSEVVSFPTAVYGLVMYLPAFALVVLGRRLLPHGDEEAADEGAAAAR